MDNQSSPENNYNGEVDHHRGRRNGDSQETVDIVIPQEISQLLLVSQPKKWERPRIEKVPPQLRQRKEQSEHVYDPVMVSLGPYHHGKQELRRAEEFKYHCLDWCDGGDEEKKVVFYKNIVENIAEIRECYAEVTIVDKYDDKALAPMMLLDACFLINFMHNYLDMEGHNKLDWRKCLGAASESFMARDMILLENQIPFQVLKLLISLQYEKEEAEGFLQRFISASMGIDDLNHAKIPEEIDEAPPIHFVEAYWRLRTKKPINESPNHLAPKFRCPRFLREVHNQIASKFRWPPRFSMREEKNDEIDISYAHHSVMDLKAKGIHFSPSSSQSLKDITFTSHAFYGQLQLPVRFLSDVIPVTFSNLIAYELSPNRNIIDPITLSYVVFIKSLIQSPEDVKELQEKGILLNNFANLEKVVKLFKEIDTFGLNAQDIFIDVKQKVEEHCNNKAKTWIADLIHTRFQTPWTTIALFAAVFLLCLTFLQTYFTINPVK